MPAATENKAAVDNRGFLRVDGVPICKVQPSGQLEIADKDRLRAVERGTRMVSFTVEDIVEAICLYVEIEE